MKSFEALTRKGGTPGRFWLLVFLVLFPMLSRSGVSWEPYQGQWNYVDLSVQTVPNVTAFWNAGTIYSNRHALRYYNTPTLNNNTTYYVRLAMGRPNWSGDPNTVFWNSYSTSPPFTVNDADPNGYSDLASSTYFNNSQTRVAAAPLAAGGVAITPFSNSGGGFWRIRRRISVAERNITDRINAPCRYTVAALLAGEIATGRSAQAVRVADEYGNELPCWVASETAAAGSVTAFTVHFLIPGLTANTTDYFWIYWGNSSAGAPAYSWAANGLRT